MIVQCNLQLTLLSVAEVPLQTISWVLEGFPVLRTLNLSETCLDSLPEVGFQPLQHLQTLDLRGCPLTTFYSGVFDGLMELKQLYADNFKLCCPQIFPPEPDRLVVLWTVDSRHCKTHISNTF
jgi:hypothetical protein